MSSKIQNRIKIAASPDRVWAVLGDLAAAHTWIPGITTAKVEGMKRVCTTADGREIREEISDYSAEKRTYRYKHLQQPLPVKNSHGIFTLQAEGAGSVVVWEAEFEVPDPTQGWRFYRFAPTMRRTIKFLTWPNRRRGGSSTTLARPLATFTRPRRLPF